MTGNGKFESSQPTVAVGQENLAVVPLTESLPEALTERYGYLYDKRGNLLTETKGEDVSNAVGSTVAETIISRYEYDTNSRMINGTNEKGDESRYIYDGLGFRVETEQIIQGVVSRNEYVVDPITADSRDLMVYSDDLVKRYVYGYGKISETRYSVQNQSANGQNANSQNLLDPKNPKDFVKTYIHQDRLGSTSYVSDELGNMLAYVKQDEWGRVKEIVALNPNTSSPDAGRPSVDRTSLADFTGHGYDNILDVYYAQFRMYDPVNKRFISEDVSKNGVNWYVYCSSNPIMFVDPNGLAAVYLRQYVESRGGYVLWDEKTKVATAHLNGKSISSNDPSRFVIIQNSVMVDDAVLIQAFGLNKDGTVPYAGNSPAFPSGNSTINSNGVVIGSNKTPPQNNVSYPSVGNQPQNNQYQNIDPVAGATRGSFNSANSYNQHANLLVAGAIQRFASNPQAIQYLKEVGLWIISIVFGSALLDYTVDDFVNDIKSVSSWAYNGIKSWVTGLFNNGSSTTQQKTQKETNRTVLQETVSLMVDSGVDPKKLTYDDVARYAAQARTNILYPSSVGGDATVSGGISVNASGRTITVDGTKYNCDTKAEEVTLTMQNNKDTYYPAVLADGAVWVAPVAIPRSVALAIMSFNSSSAGVFAIKESDSRGLCSSLGGYRGPEQGGSTSGWWPHYHGNNVPKAHCWYID